MLLESHESDRRLTVKIKGELDHHGAKKIMLAIAEKIDVALPELLVIDLGELTFCDSSGIAVLLRASRRMAQLGGALKVISVPKQAEKVFAAAGLTRIISFE